MKCHSFIKLFIRNLALKVENPIQKLGKYKYPLSSCWPERNSRNMEKLAEFNKENCVKWMAGIGASTSG